MNKKNLKQHLSNQYRILREKTASLDNKTFTKLYEDLDESIRYAGFDMQDSVTVSAICSQVYVKAVSYQLEVPDNFL